jgi:choline dehydrogenase-like flavoprotein
MPWAYSKTKIRAELAVTEKTQEEFRIVNGTAGLIPKEVAENQPANINSFPEDARKTVRMWENMDELKQKKKLPEEQNFWFREFELFTRLEQSPNPDSRIFLDTELDALGVPRANLDWRLTPLEKRSLRSLQEIIGREMGRYDIARIRINDWLQNERDDEWPSILGGGWHHMGTTKMGESPTEGVVDKNCKVFGLDNLFMAGSSCFSTAGAANPTLTLVALTLRLSDFLKNMISKRSVNKDLV